MKIIGLALIIISSTLVGFFYGEKLRKRVKQLKELQRGIYVLKNEINFTHSLLPEALLKAYEKCTPEIGSIFRDTSSIMLNNEDKDVYNCFLTSINAHKNSLSLSKEDLGIFLDFSKTLGEMDISGHNDLFGLTLENFDKAIKNAEETLDKNIKMYRYLGFSFGAMTAIILF